MAEKRKIDTGLTGPDNKTILDCVIAQLSDGIWENSPAMAKYWKFANIGEEGGKIFIVVGDDFGSGFYRKNEAWIKNFFAGKIKQIVYDEIKQITGGAQWNRQDKTLSDYLGSVPISDAYRAYEILKGRNVKDKYAPAPEVNQAVESKARQLVDAILKEDGDTPSAARWNSEIAFSFNQAYTNGDQEQMDAIAQSVIDGNFTIGELISLGFIFKTFKNASSLGALLRLLERKGH